MFALTMRWQWKALGSLHRLSMHIGGSRMAGPLHGFLSCARQYWSPKILLSPCVKPWKLPSMVSLAEFKEQVAALPVEQRASLASFLLHSLPDPDYDVSDEEVAERVRETKSGEIGTISMDELRNGVFSDRGH